MSTTVGSAPPAASDASTAVRPRPRLTAAKKRQYGAAYALVLPFFVIFIAMMIVPLVYAGYLSLFRTKLIGGTSFAGWRTTPRPSPTRCSWPGCFGWASSWLSRCRSCSAWRCSSRWRWTAA